jgi:hypothetical protein
VVNITSTTFTNNVGSLEAGAVFFTGTNMRYNLSGSLFSGNIANGPDSSATRGGALVATGTDPVLNFSKCDFLNNVSKFRGGAMHIEATRDSATWRDCRFEGNETRSMTGDFSSGASVLYHGNSSSPGSVRPLAFERCVITSNTAAGTIGAIKEDRSTGTLYSFVDCVITKNVVKAPGTIGNPGNGGFMEIENAEANFTNCLFEENRQDIAVKTGGGGGVFYLTTNGNTARKNILNFTGCDFNSNAARGTDGGGVFRTANQNNPSALTFTDCSFDKNSALAAGAIRSSGDLSIDRCVFTTVSVNRSFFRDNTARTGGGVMQSNSNIPTVSFVNNVFVNNKQYGIGVDDRGGVYHQRDDADTANISFLNNTFARNHSASRGMSLAFRANQVTSVVNCLFHDHTSANGSATNVANVDNLENCLFFKSRSNEGQLGFQNAAHWDAASVATHCIPTDPLSIGENPLLSNPLGLNAADYGILAGSPAIDAGKTAGAPGVDHAGTARPQLGGCDIGAFEGTVLLQPPTSVNGNMWQMY